MKQNKNNLIFKTLGMGAIAGMRSMTAPALLSTALTHAPKEALTRSPLRYLQYGPVATGLKVMAATELVGDKLPGAPDRIAAPVLLPRAASGALVGAAIFTLNHDNWLQGAAYGAAAAVAATFGSYYLRKLMNRYAPNAFSGALEDMLTLAGGVALTKFKV
ncbi:DUF4126 family protein [Pontibacter liquoris]|uniref:DUF4126 family protein n=1 Tax=Pontibacter liquoris TaxID=2905677 RepID=UPI001FA74C00|nr:DUF4126 family protein [Pontibacter liquoris]